MSLKLKSNPSKVTRLLSNELSNGDQRNVISLAVHVLTMTSQCDVVNHPITVRLLVELMCGDCDVIPSFVASQSDECDVTMPSKAEVDVWRTTRRRAFECLVEINSLFLLFISLFLYIIFRKRGFYIWVKYFFLYIYVH